MHQTHQKVENLAHNHHQVFSKCRLQTLNSHLRLHSRRQSRCLLLHRHHRLLQLAVALTYRLPGRAPVRCSRARGLRSLRKKPPRCHCPNPNQQHQFPHLTQHFCHFGCLDLAILPREGMQWEDFPHFGCYGQRPRCFGWTPPARWTDCHCGLTAGIAVLRWRATVLRAASQSGPLTDWTEQAYSGRCSMKSSTNSASACWRWIGYSGSWSSGRPSATSPAGREQPV